MRRSLSAVLCCLLLVVTGCQAPGAPGSATGGDPAPATPIESEVVENDTVRPDPPSDRLGWEQGVWHNETLAITPADGLNETERTAVVARAMARVEYVRELEFTGSVPVEIVSRAEYRNRTAGSTPDAVRRFDNAKFEALFLIGEDRDSIAVQQSNLASGVLGYYTASGDKIVLITDSETPTIDEGTLAHELVHALQDQQFGLEDEARTRDGVQGENGLVEGDATATQQLYADRCGEAWNCLDGSAGGSAGGDRHFGVVFMKFFPYSDGPGFVTALRDRGGWTAVDDAYADYPESAVEIIAPERYPDWEAETVRLRDRSTEEWQRVRPSTARDRPDYATVGPSAIAATLAYTLADDYNESALVGRDEVFNYDDGGGGLDRSDPYNYSHPATRGWAGGRMHVYRNGDESAYVWKTTWESEADARRFADTWARVVQHWGGTRTGEGTWVIESGSPYADAVEIRVEGRSVTVVNAPEESELEAVHGA